MVQNLGLCLGFSVSILVHSRLAVPSIADYEKGGRRFQMECFSFAGSTEIVVSVEWSETLCLRQDQI